MTAEVTGSIKGRQEEVCRGGSGASVCVHGGEGGGIRLPFGAGGL